MSKRELTEEQKPIVRHRTGHALVEAGPGSGKTTVLVARTRRMLKTGADAGSMLVLMFNVEARQSFEARLRRALGDSADIPEVMTLNAMGNRMLKKLVHAGALPREQLVTGRGVDAFMRNALKRAFAEAGDAVPTQMQFQGFQRFCTLVKSQLGPAHEVFEKYSFSQTCSAYVPAFAYLVEDQRRTKKMFLDDQIYRTVSFLTENPTYWSMFAGKYTDILIDEFQDINAISFEMVRGLVGTTTSLVAVGDPKQSIYGFRGSDVELMTKKFAETFSPCSHYPMNRTFRFGHEIALFANNIISVSKDRGNGLAIAHDDNPRSRVERYPIQPSRPSALIELLSPFEGAGRLRETAMLARNFSHLIPFEIELLENGTPFWVYGRKPLLWIPEIAALVCALCIAADRWIMAPDNRMDFVFSMLATPTPFLSHEVLGEIAEEMEGFLDGADRTKLAGILLKHVAALGSRYPGAARGLRDRADVLRLLADGSLQRADAGVIVNAYVAHTGMRDVLLRAAATPDQGAESVANLDAFVKFAEKSGSLAQFLDILSPMAAVKEANPPEGDHVSLMTIHRSKGLEWPLVMMVGLVNGSFPSTMEDSDQEEERRLAFVAATRAMDRLALFYPADPLLERTIKERDWHARSVADATASPFLFDGDIGVAQAITVLLEDGRGGRVVARQDRALSEYIDAVGADVEVQLTEEGRAAVARAAQVALHGIMPPDYRAKADDELYHPEHGACTVLRVLHHPIYQLVVQETGESVTSVVEPGTDWVLPVKLAATA